MDIRIGIVNAPREVGIEMPDDNSAADVKAMIDDAVAAGAGLIWLTDKKGRELGFPADKVAYVEIGSSEDQRIGFS
ncbi:MAG: DUF3107 domain-containing protein [Acidimicrobiales bacterium]